jgi:anti-anti-sigma factor
MNLRPQTLVLASDLGELSRLVAFVDAFCAPLTLSDKHQMSLHLALEEMVTNVIQHGYGAADGHRFSVMLETPVAGRIRATIIDSAPAYDPFARPRLDRQEALEDLPVGGLGVHLVRQLMDVCRHERREDRNIITLELVHGVNDHILHVAPRLDTLTSPVLEQEVETLLMEGVQHVSFDLSRLDYVSSAGLRVFILAAKKFKARGGRAVFLSPTPAVKEVLRVSGLLGALEVRG